MNIGAVKEVDRIAHAFRRLPEKSPVRQKYLRLADALVKQVASDLGLRARASVFDMAACLAVAPDKTALSPQAELRFAWLRRFIKAGPDQTVRPPWRSKKKAA